MAKGTRGGKYSSGAPTKARAVENMNEAQINRELGIAQRQLKKAKDDRAKYGRVTASEAAMRDQYSLGAGGMSTAEAQRYTGQKAEQAITRGKKLENAMDREEAARKRIETLEAAKKEIAGTGKTRKQLRDESKATAATSVKWKTKKEGNITTYTADGGLKITRRGTGFFSININGNYYNYSKLAEAKAAAVLFAKRRK